MTPWMAPRALADGVAAAARRPRLIVGLWLWQLAVAVAGTLPVFQWLRDTTGRRPAADRLLYRFSLPDFVDAVRTSQGSPTATWNAALGGALLLTVVTTPIVVAMTVAALREPGGEDAAGAIRHAGQSYWRLLRLTVFGRGIAIAAAALAMLGLAWALGQGRETSDWSFLAALGLETVVAASIAAWLWTAVDVGAIAIVHDRARGAFNGWMTGLRTVLRTPAFTLVLWASFALVLIVGLLLVAAGTASLPATTLPLIALMAALHQSFAMLRVILRVGVLSAEMGAWARVWPPTPLLATPATTALEPLADSIHHEEYPRPGQDGEREVDDGESRE